MVDYFLGEAPLSVDMLIVEAISLKGEAEAKGSRVTTRTAGLRSSRPAVVSFGFAALMLLLLAGCSNAGATTCDEYAAMDSSERMSTDSGLLRAHDLDTDDVGNTLGVSAAIQAYCGVAGNSIAGLPGSEAATKNNGSEIDNAADWTATTW